MNPLQLEIFAHFVLYFLKHGGIAVLIAAPAIAFLIAKRRSN